MSLPFLSIILPAHDEESRLPSALDALLAFLDAQPYASEVLVVENGSRDRTLALAQEYSRLYPQISVCHEARRGKGLAVRRGMLAARGEHRFMCDVDFSMPVDQLSRFLPPALDAYDVAIASREAPGAVRYNEPAHRHLVGRAFNLLIRLMALPGLHDTQCGFKCFRGRVAEQLFGRQTLCGWSFDVEILFIARKLGYSILELPIPWYFNPDSKVRVVPDSVHMALDILRIRYNYLTGAYSLERHA
ncbi:MAG: glycosyltransferase family 2 protein [Anaerolineales bacterium]|nr:glycosyltransferase family 2 protein [Anaerolineales bacterium]